VRVSIKKEPRVGRNNVHTVKTPAGPEIGVFKEAASPLPVAPACAPETAEYKPHPLAAVFPPLPPEDFEALVGDIRENGVRDEIILTPNGEVLDGINRLRASKEAGVEPRFKITEEPPEKWASLVISKNLHRRHLTSSQRAAIAAELVTTKHGDNQHSGGAANLPVLSQPEAAAKLQTSERNVRDAAKVKSLSKELHESVKAGKVSVATAADVARTVPEKINEFIEQVNSGKSPTEARQQIKGRREEATSKGHMVRVILRQRAASTRLTAGVMSLLSKSAKRLRSRVCQRNPKAVAVLGRS
jgi:ParB-like chromosome segregation protein Spo0J